MFKIAFLFLTLTGVYYEHLWEQYFASHEHQYTIYVHAKHTVPKNSFLQPYSIKTVENSWANTMIAQRALLSVALDDTDNEWFIFISESTIPLRPFNELYTFLASSEKSYFHYLPNNRPRYTEMVSRHMHRKSSQWCILNRKHAQMIVDDTTLINLVIKYPNDQEHYPATLLHMHGEGENIINRMTTYVNWHNRNTGIAHPYQFNNVSSAKEQAFMKDAKKTECFFVRKIKEGIDLTPIHSLLPYIQD